MSREHPTDACQPVRRPQDVAYPSSAPKIHKLLQRGKGGMTVEVSSKQVKQNVTKHGGFLLMLAELAASAFPVLAKTVLPALGVGTLSGLGSAAISKSLGSGLYLKRGGKVCCVNVQGKGLYLSPSSAPIAQGDGLYLKRAALLLLLGSDLGTQQPLQERSSLRHASLCHK